MLAATQNRHGTFGFQGNDTPRAAAPRAADAAQRGPALLAAVTMSATPRLFKIQGITREGKAFRPSGWTERLAGALSSFRPVGLGIGAHIGYSP
jgi:Protein of unknown function (DUF3579)